MAEFEQIYITTPVFYPSGNLHLGHAFTSVIADVISRYYKLINVPTWFVTGSDEHGEKILKTAQAKNKDVEILIEENVNNFKRLFESLNISYDCFVRTTDKTHKSFVQKAFTNLSKDQKIVHGFWKGYYCVICEESYGAKVWGKKNTCDLSHALVEKNEETYFLKVKDELEWITNVYKTNETTICPDFYKAHLYNDVFKNIEDLSITRKYLSWGIAPIEHPEYKIYVWFDALLSYLSADQNSWWNTKNTKIIHVIGKDILRFHAVYWPIILKNMKLRIFDKLICHGWLLLNDKKMSKSSENVVDPLDLIALYSSDVVRFFLVNLNWGDDNKYCNNDIHIANNTYLANIFGNIVSRFFGIIKKNNFLIGSWNDVVVNEPLQKLNNEIEIFIKKAPELIRKEDIKQLLEEQFALLKSLNKIIDELEVWNLSLENPLFNNIIISMYRLISLANFSLSPILINKSQEVWKILNIDNPESFDFFLDIKLFFNKKLKQPKNILFERYDLLKTKK